MVGYMLKTWKFCYFWQGYTDMGIANAHTDVSSKRTSLQPQIDNIQKANTDAVRAGKSYKLFALENLVTQKSPQKCMIFDKNTEFKSIKKGANPHSGKK